MSCDVFWLSVNWTLADLSYTTRTEEKSMKKKKRHNYTPEEKVLILKRHLTEGVAVSALCDGAFSGAFSGAFRVRSL